MIHTDTKILSLAAALLLCFGTYALAAPPEGKGGGKGGKGNQPIAATANFTDLPNLIEIMSNTALQGEFIDNGDFDTLTGQLAIGETITIGGDAGAGLAALDPIHSILPTGATASCNGNCSVLFAVLSNDENSGVTWTIRLDRDKQPANRVQFKMRWVNDDGLERHFRMGWVVQAYEDEIYPLPNSEYGYVIDNGTSLESATVIFAAVFFRIDGDVLVPGRGKKTKTKTELEVFSHYGEVYDATVASWCAMGGTLGEVDPADPNNTIFPCRESTTIQTATNP